MKLWKISQTENDGYDTYDSAIVAAETEDEARKISPETGTSWMGSWGKRYYSSWCSHPDKVTAELIGVANDDIPAGVVLSSFNAG